MVDTNLVTGVVVLNDPEVKVASEFMCLKPSVTTPVSVHNPHSHEIGGLVQESVKLFL